MVQLSSLRERFEFPVEQDGLEYTDFQKRPAEEEAQKSLEPVTRSSFGTLHFSVTQNSCFQILEKDCLVVMCVKMAIQLVQGNEQFPPAYLLPTQFSQEESQDLFHCAISLRLKILQMCSRAHWPPHF